MKNTVTLLAFALISMVVSPSSIHAAIDSLNGQTGSTQTFSNDSNVIINSASDVHSLGWNGVLPIPRGGTGASAFTSGSIPFFNGSIFSENNGNLFWDNSNARLGIGTSSPAQTLSVATGQILGPSGTVSLPTYSFNNDSNTGVFLRADGEIGFTANGTLSLVVEQGRAAAELGSVTNPSYAFRQDSDTGLYRLANDTLAVTAGSANALITSSASSTFPGTLSVGGQAFATTGTASLPSYSFGSDQNTGMFLRAADEIGFATNGNLSFAIEQGRAAAELGSATNPSYTFRQDSDTGLYRVANDSMGITAGGSQRFVFAPATSTAIGAFVVTGQIQGADGTTSLPSYSFSNDSNTGMFLRAADEIGFVTNGSLSFAVEQGRAAAELGSATTPSYTFRQDSDTGLFRPANDSLGITTAGTERIRIDGSGKVGIGTNSPSGDLQVLGSSNTTIYVGNSSIPGCLAIGDSDGSGITYVTVNDGVLSATSTKPSDCQ